MNRSVRNGLVIAGMAGGMLFLGQAVANANTEAEGSIDNSTAALQPFGGSGGGADADTTIDQDVTAQQTTNNTVDIAPVSGGPGGVAVAVADTSVNNTTVAAIGSKHSDVSAPVTIGTGDATANASAPGGNVQTNNNLNVGGAPTGDVSATGTIVNDTTAVSTGSSGGGADADTDIDQDIASEQTTNNTVGVGPVSGGPGGLAVAVADTSVNDTKVFCFAPRGDVYCPVTITTGDATANAGAPGGNVQTNNNLNVGSTVTTPPAAQKPSGHHHHHDGHHADRPDHKPAAAPVHHAKRAAPAAHRAAPAAHRGPGHSSAQPKGQLAYTGAETTAPLTLGLIALGAGGALTLAGRRRTSTATV